MPVGADKVYIEQIIAAARSALGNPGEAVPLHCPVFSGNEWAYVKDCVDSAWVATTGKYITEFEARLAAFTGSPYVIAVVNGTAALHVALQLAGVGAGEEVLMPSLTFVATANAASYCNAIPHFCDVEQSTLGLDPRKLGEYLGRIAELRSGSCYNRATGRRIAAILPMHALGHPVDMDPLMEVAKHYDLPVVEDAAESLGSYYHGRHTGTLGPFGVLSFNSNKVVTTGAGGAILTRDASVAEHVRHLTTTAKVPHPWEFIHDEIGYNYRMPNLNAALGCAQVERLPEFLQLKRELARKYILAFAGMEGVKVLTEPEGSRSNYWLNTIILDDASWRAPLLDALNAAGLQSRAIWRPMHKLVMYEQCPRMELPVTEYLELRTLNLPSTFAQTPHGTNSMGELRVG